MKYTDGVQHSIIRGDIGAATVCHKYSRITPLSTAHKRLCIFGAAVLLENSRPSSAELVTKFTDTPDPHP
jgi:hypothetical protein